MLQCSDAVENEDVEPPPDIITSGMLLRLGGPEIWKTGTSKPGDKKVAGLDEYESNMESIWPMEFPLTKHG
jgi:hypothetical protein